MSANDYQVGGDHYRGPLQHWDFMAEHGMGYFEGQITKYATRHYKKNKLLDCQKCLQFCEKLLELAHTDFPPIGRAPKEERFREYAEFNELSDLEMNVIRRAMTWKSTADLIDLRHFAQKLVAYWPPAPPAPAPYLPTGRVTAPAAPMQPRFGATGREAAMRKPATNAVQHKSTMGRGATRYVRDVHDMEQGRIPIEAAGGVDPDARDDMQQFGTPGEEH